ncbi:hypothetical protein JR316_0000475 [Psilocybe cubensis]|uniref:Uncharacterized protein n=2 Tax=Psilocybe cubensis TaxID=181762 RepID=A0ACB8HEP9_PSICU|nr:hypothetical protein JR316_0000475 [Psilocybe cubensis]KAH9486411.1 hypothetical protein JR316_0000475 [Psilocybe cubensis]
MPPLTPATTIDPPKPLLKFRIDDLSHKGVSIFLNAVDPGQVLSQALAASFRWLYTPETALPEYGILLLHLCDDLTRNSVKEVTLVLCTSGTIARTSFTVKDGGVYIESLLSLSYIVHSEDRVEDEITGLLIHEIAHCLLRLHSKSKCPSGVLVGIADYVRLREYYGPPHWTQNTKGSWNDGFDKTAYFLDWIEKKRCEGTVRKLVAALKAEYSDDLFAQITGVSVSDLWKQYVEHVESNHQDEVHAEEEQESANPLAAWPMPKLNIRVEDLDHEGVDIFFGAVKPKEALKTSVLASFNQLYTLSNVPTNVKEILLVLRDMGGVAYTIGSASHKEIHFSLNYIKATKHRASEEILGVLVHEVVHCYQYNARGTCPGGLIEGIADFVRLHESLGPPHWRRSTGGNWDDGYDTTAYFLDWIEQSFGKGTIQKLNYRMKRARYDHGLFKELTGREIDELWANYVSSLAGGDDAKDR